MTLQMLDDIVSREPRIDMKDRDGKSRMKGLLMFYNALLKRNGRSWVLKNNAKLAVKHVCAAVKPLSLQNRLMNDLECSHYHLRKYFEGFLSHACYESEAFQWSNPAVHTVDTSGGWKKTRSR